MPRQYTHVGREEFESYLSDHAEWEEVEMEGVDERVYKIPLPSEHHDVLIFSTLEGDSSRGHGEDAIRTVVWDWRVDRPVSGRKKTLRIGPSESNPDGWKGNHLPKLRSLMASWRDYVVDCPECSAPMVFHADHDFFGCSVYPDCEGTRNSGL